MGINGKDDMLSNARNAGSRPLHGERDLIDRGLLTSGWSRRGEEKSCLWIQTVQGYRA